MLTKVINARSDVWMEFSSVTAKGVAFALCWTYGSAYFFDGYAIEAVHFCAEHLSLGNGLITLCVLDVVVRRVGRVISSPYKYMAQVVRALAGHIIYFSSSQIRAFFPCVYLSPFE